MPAVQFPKPSARIASHHQYLWLLLAMSTVFAFTSISSAQCMPNPANNTLTICTPLNNQTVPSTFTVSAVATSSAAVTKFLVYLDSVLKFQQLNTKSISTTLTAAAGPHNLTVQYYNGAWIKNTEFHHCCNRSRYLGHCESEFCERDYWRNATIHSFGYWHFEHGSDLGR